jgi:hypothetical protein
MSMKKEKLGPGIFGRENGHLSTHFPKMKGYGLSLVRTQQYILYRYLTGRQFGFVYSLLIIGIVYIGFLTTHCKESLFLCIVLAFDNCSVGPKLLVNTSTFL